jgi:hypothetical protein
MTSLCAVSNSLINYEVLSYWLDQQPFRGMPPDSYLYFED